MSYCISADLAEYRPNIHGLGVLDWTATIAKADAQINRAIEKQWYRPECIARNLDYRSTVFDPALLLTAATQLKEASVYLSLKLAYMFLMKDSAEADAFERQMKLFGDMYKEELIETLSSGIDYDWDGNDEIGASEKLAPKVRRLRRC